MRLLRRSKTGEFILTEDLFDDETTPAYAILSHTWLEDMQEPTFEDLTKGTGGEKLGYEKIRFCEKQANRDGLQHFWVDTCCINKRNFAELSQAINSMFRWYYNATRCYVYLSDVSSPCTNDELYSQSWNSDLARSRWFTRGWTLQELLAPRSVEFFSCEGMRLGDRNSLSHQIQQITGIPASALRGARLSEFSIDERILWMERRQTKVAEDKVYSLLGILDVEIPLYYGEGAANASKRVREVIDKRENCLKDLHLTDPRHDKKRIEGTKGRLLKDSYRWILYHSSFRQWRYDQQGRLLWIKGDPGKGKTMLLCGIVNELKTSIAKTDLLSYFFCQATDSRINNATAVLRGLLYLLVDQQPSLISHIRKKHDHAGKALFEDANTWVALSEIFTNILQDPRLNSTYLVIDALDECITELPKLLDFIVQKSSISPCVKWIVSSRNWPDIEERLERAGHKVRLCLELNTESISAAVSKFIKFKVLQLAHEKKYDRNTQNAVFDHLSSNANNTFLWVALVCQNLEKIHRWETLVKLDAFPPGLDSLYERMMKHVCSSAHAEICKRILAVISTVYRPVTLDELASFVDMPDGVAGEYEALSEIIGLCGSFLTLQERTISFVHQSAKDFLLTGASNEIFPSGKEETHHEIFSRSLKVISRTLRRDIYGLGALGCHIERVERPDPDRLVALRYSIIHWIDHLHDWNLNSTNHGIDSQDKDAIENFIRKQYLYWLEALSLCRSMSEGVLGMVKLSALAQRIADTPSFIKVLQDARLFIMYHVQAIQNSPLQVYVSALVFSPDRSLIRGYFKKEEPNWISIKPAIGDQWSACLQTLEGHRDYVNSVAFSHDSARLASASYDKTVKIWDASSGKCLQTFKSHRNYVNSVAFSHDSARLASASDDETVKIWDASSGECLQTLEGHRSCVRSVAFSHDSARLASASDDKTVKIWDASSGECLQTLEGHRGYVRSVAFSHDSARLASASYDGTVKIWDTSSGECLQTLEGHRNYVNSVAFSYDSARLVSASDDKTVKIWDTSSGECLQTFKSHRSYVRSVAFSHDSARLASASDDKTVKIWDASSGECLQTLIIGKTLYRISFNITDSYLQTDIGTIEISALLGSKSLLSHLEPQSPQYQGLALSADSVWITYNLENLIWLPSEYQPSCSVVSEKMIGIGVKTGRVSIYKVELNTF